MTEREQGRGWGREGLIFSACMCLWREAGVWWRERDRAKMGKFRVCMCKEGKRKCREDLPGVMAGDKRRRRRRKGIKNRFTLITLPNTTFTTIITIATMNPLSPHHHHLHLCQTPPRGDWSTHLLLTVTCISSFCCLCIIYRRAAESHTSAPRRKQSFLPINKCIFSFNGHKSTFYSSPAMV